MQPATHTIRFSHTPTSVTIELDDPSMSIEVRVRTESKRRHHVEIWRPLPSGALAQAGVLGCSKSLAAAMETCLDVAHVLAIGLGVKALAGEVEPTTTLVPASTSPRTFELVEHAKQAVREIVRRFGMTKDVRLAA